MACERLKHPWKLWLVAVLADSFVSGFIMSRGMIAVYLPFLISGFNRIGLLMRPAVTQLQVPRLNGSYIADKKYLLRELRNTSMSRMRLANL